MENIIDELKQVFEFEGEISEVNIEIDEAWQMLIIKNITILKILDTYKKEYNLKFVRVDFNCNLFDLFEKYNSLGFDGYMYFDTCNFNNDIDCNGLDSVVVCDYSINFNECFFNKNIELSHIAFLKSIEFKKIRFGNENETINVNFTDINFDNSIKFEEVKFYCNTKFDLCNFGNETIQTYVDFNNFYVYGNLEFYGGKIYSDLKFLQSIFGKEDLHNEIKFEAVSFYNSVDFSNNEFYSDFEISSCEFKKNKEKSNYCDFNNNFYNKFYIGYNTFEIPLNFIDVKIINNKDEAIFKNSTFLNDFKFYDTQFGQNAIFEKCTFKNLEGFEDKEFDENLEFRECVFKESVSFKDCNFKKYVNFKHSKFIKEVNLSNTVFNQDVNFSHCKFKEEVIFNNSIFNQIADFSDSTFFKHAYFPWIHSKYLIHFYNTNFKEIANFYFAIFEYVPNFSTCAFEKVNLVNLIGVDLSLIDIKKIEEYTEEMKNKDKTDNKNIKVDHYYLIQHSQGAKDSFRNIKEVLNSQSNLLESQKWHKLELYAQEVELKYRITTKNMYEEYKNNSNKESKRMLKINIKNKLNNIVDLFQLWIYKTTSNHHSDLLLILLTTFSVIGIYHLAYITIEQYYFQSYSSIVYLLIFFFYCSISIIPCFTIIFIIQNCLNIKLIFYKKIKYYLHKAKYIILIIFSLISICGILQTPSIVTPFIGVFSDNTKNHFLNKAIINLECYQAIRIANRLNPTTIYLNESQAKKDLLANKDIIKEDKLILDAYNKTLLKGKNADEIMARINIIYYILMILCLFSLQKTARKNSIIPS